MTSHSSSENVRVGPTISIAIVALVFAAVALVFSALVLQGAADDWRALLWAAPLAAALCGMLFWRLLVVRSGQRVVLRGVLAGALAGMLANPLAWYLVILYFYVSGARSSLGELTLNPIEGLLGSIIFALGSGLVLLVGWIPIPVGALVGGLLAFLLHRPR